MYVAHRHPDIGETVGNYKVVEILGQGGLGVVFKVERDGRFYAMKFLLLPKLDGRAKREITVLNHLDNPCVVHYVGSDYWPNPVTGYPYIVMEYVPGDTLEEFAFKQNPSARKATRIVLDVARTLGEVHGAGVFHRDLKPTNIVIRGASERPILIDFGIADLVGAACLTGTSLPPATEEYRAPESLRFRRDHPSGAARYEFGPLDELWALGVTFYWLLTEEMPFGTRMDDGGLEGLHERLLTQRPVEPHLVNPRVPLAVSRLCMTMLAEWPADRFPNIPALCMALQEALTQADDDPAWDVPLVDPHDPQDNTTAEEPTMLEPNEALREFRKRRNRRPRRGLVRLNQAPVFPAVPVHGVNSRAPLAGVEPERIATVTPVQAALGGPWRLGLVAALLAVAVGILSLRMAVWGPDTSSHVSSERGARTPLSASPLRPSTEGAAPGRELASPWKPPDSLFKVGAAPLWAPPPAPPATAMSSTLTQTPKNETPKSQLQRAGFRPPVKPTTVAAAALAACSVVGAGCTGSASQVRPEPPPIACPVGWQSTHSRFHVGGGDLALGGTQGRMGEEAWIQEGPATVTVDDSIVGLPEGTLLSGEWRFGKDRLGKDRLFATFTQAQVPGEGTLPVCLVVMEPVGTISGCGSGLGTCPRPGSTRGKIKTFERLRVYRFGFLD